KLKSNPHDFEAYKKLYDDPRVHIQASNITMNYNYFYERLENINLNLDELFESINKLQVMVVNLNSPNDAPQLIFESLNSTGVDLTNADKIRNYLLMNEPQDSQNELFVNYWQPIEERTHLKISDFFKDFLTLKEGRTPVIAKVYEAFVEYYSKIETGADSSSNIKKYFFKKLLKIKKEHTPIIAKVYEAFVKYYSKIETGADSSSNIKKDFFKELAEYSIAYEHILKFNTDNKDINEFLKRLNFVNVTVA